MTKNCYEPTSADLYVYQFPLDDNIFNLVDDSSIWWNPYGSPSVAMMIYCDGKYVVIYITNLQQLHVGVVQCYVIYYVCTSMPLSVSAARVCLF